MMQVAQITSPFKGVQIPTDNTGAVNVNNTTLGTVITKVLPYVFDAAGLLLLVYLVLGGLQLMTSRGDPKAVQAAQAKITSALIGFVIIFLAAAIVILLGQMFGISMFSQLFQ